MTSASGQVLAALGFPIDTVALVVQQPVQAYRDVFACRDAGRQLPPGLVMVVVNRAEGTAVTPVNLAAALAADQAARDVYLWEDQPSGSLVSRVRAAGIRGVIDRTQLSQLLAAAPASTGAVAVSRPESFEIEEPAESLATPVQYAPPTVADMVYPAASLQTPPVSLQAPATNTQALTANPQILTTAVGTGLIPISMASNVVGIFSGRGGVGKSTVALLLALMASRRGLRTALVDADLQFGDIAYLLGHSTAQQAVVQALLGFQPSALPEASANSGMASPLLVLTAPESVEQSELLVDAVPEIVCQVANRHDLVIINTSAFWTATQAQLARNCSRLLFLMDQRATSIKACQRVLELCIKLQIPEARFAYALNGCHRFAPISPQDASLALGGQEIYRLEDGGTLVDEMLSLGCPWELLDSGNAFVASLDKMLDCLLPLGFNNAMPASSPNQQAKPGFGLDKLKQLFSKGARDVA